MVKKIWEESHNKSQAEKSADKVATLQSDSGAEGMASNIPQQVEKSPVQGPTCPLTKVDFDHGPESIQHMRNM